jgi:hypothetical protein
MHSTASTEIVAENALPGVRFPYAGRPGSAAHAKTTGRLAMGYLLVRHKVREYHEWRRVFDRHKDAQQHAGLRVEKVMRNLYEPEEVFLLFEVLDLAKARGFLSSAEVSAAQEEAGVVGEADIYFLA